VVGVVGGERVVAVGVATVKVAAAVVEEEG